MSRQLHVHARTRHVRQAADGCVARSALSLKPVVANNLVSSSDLHSLLRELSCLQGGGTAHRAGLQPDARQAADCCVALSRSAEDRKPISLSLAEQPCLHREVAQRTWQDFSQMRAKLQTAVEAATSSCCRMHPSYHTQRCSAYREVAQRTGQDFSQTRAKLQTAVQRQQELGASQAKISEVCCWIAISCWRTLPHTSACATTWCSPVHQARESVSRLQTAVQQQQELGPFQTKVSELRSGAE